MINTTDLLIPNTTVINTTDLFTNKATKTASILAMRVYSNIRESLLPLLYLKTLEGDEVLDVHNYICKGMEHGEPWQQTEKALLKKYTPIPRWKGDWQIYIPIEGNEVEFFYSDVDGYVQGMWGETVDGMPNMQWVRCGDAICRQVNDHSDQWCVKRYLFDATYTVVKS